MWCSPSSVLSGHYEVMVLFSGWSGMGRVNAITAISTKPGAFPHRTLYLRSAAMINRGFQAFIYCHLDTLKCVS